MTMGVVAVIVGLEEDTVGVSGRSVLDVDAEDKLIPPKASARSDTLGKQASTLKRRSTLSPAKFWIKQITKSHQPWGFLLGNCDARM